MPAKAASAVSSTDAVVGKRQEILEVAARFFLTYGYEGSSVNAMVRQSGISKESFYRYFDSKEDLFMAVVEKELRDYKRKLRRLTRDWNSEDLRESLIKVARILLEVLMAERTQALRRLIFGAINRAPELGRHYYRTGPLLAYEQLERFFAMHQDETPFDPHTLSRSFVALVLHELMLERNCGMRGSPTRDEVEALVEPIVDQFLGAYFTP